MRVLLTGASGFLGRHVLDNLHRRNIETVILGRQSIYRDGVSRFIGADLLDGPDFPALIKESAPTHLLHLAWYAEHGKYWTSPINLRWVDATARLIEAFCEAGCERVVVAGTCAEYDWSHGYCREDSTPLNPATFYGIAKDTARRLVMAVCVQHEVPCAWGRIFLPFGAGEAKLRLIPSLIEVFQGKRSPFGVNASAYRDFLHVTNVAEGFAVLLESQLNGAFNISSGQPVELMEVVRMVARLLDADPNIVLDLASERLGEPPLLVGESLKLKALGWQPALSLTEGLEQTVHEAFS